MTITRLGRETGCQFGGSENRSEARIDRACEGYMDLARTAGADGGEALILDRDQSKLRTGMLSQRETHPAGGGQGDDGASADWVRLHQPYADGLNLGGSFADG